MSDSVFYRNPAHDYPLAQRGDGVYLYDSDGRQYLDGSGGAAVSCLGHGHPEVVSAVQRQVSELAFAHTAFFTNDPQEQLASRIAERFGEPGARVYFVAGGSEANETAIKLARQYWIARQQDSKQLFISRRQSYHGNTLGALSLSGNPGRRDRYKPLLQDWPKIDPCYSYRLQEQGESDQQYAERAAASLERAINDAGAENVAAFVAETVCGATLGVVPAVADYFERVRAICDRYDVLLILDEIMCGSGRTGSYFAFEQDGVRPDIVTLAKGLGGGYQPLGATVCRDRVYRQVVEGGSDFAHGHTYVGHATACAAGVAVQKVLDEHDLLSNVRQRGVQLRERLSDAFAEHPHVGDIRGRGLFTGIELVRDKATREAPGAQLGLPALIVNRAMAEGLICYPGGGSANGRDGAHILLAPPFIYSEEHVDELVQHLIAVLADIRID